MNTVRHRHIFRTFGFVVVLCMLLNPLSHALMLVESGDSISDKHKSCHGEMSLPADTDMSSKETQSPSNHSEMSVEVCSMICAIGATTIPADSLVQEMDQAITWVSGPLQFYLPDYSSSLFKPPRFLS